MKGDYYNGRYPGQFKIQDLITLGKGDTLIYPGGCAPNIDFGVGSAKTVCTSNGFSWPDNGEFDWGGKQGGCMMCAAAWGCAANNLAGNGTPCSCNAAESGVQCSVIRNKYLGLPVSCALAYYSSGATGLTGNNIGGGFYFNAIHGDFEQYTCDPTIDAVAQQSEVAKVCSQLQYKVCRNAWQTGQPSKSNSIGYCSNYVKYSTPEAGQTVLGAAASAIADIGDKNLDTATSTSNILQLCQTGNAAGACDTQLKKLCAGKTRENIFEAYNTYLKKKQNNDPTYIVEQNIFQGCACHLDANAYAEWNKLGVDEVNVACDPVCMLPNVIPQFVNKQPAQCTQNLCVIDNVSIDVVNSQISGNINFDMICGGCTGPPGSCRCIFSDINVVTSGSQIGGLNLSQNCGNNCQIPDKNHLGSFIRVPCGSSPIPTPTPQPSPSSGWNSIKKWISNNSFLLTVITAIVVIILFALVWWYYFRQPSPPKPLGDKVTLSQAFGPYDDFNNYVNYF